MTKRQFSSKMVIATQKARAYIFAKYKLCESDVEDIIQESSLKAFKSYSKFLEKCSFDTWFISICKNEIKHLFKSNNRNDLSLSDNEVSKDLIAVDPDIKRKFEIEESEFLVRNAMQQLGQKHREIIELALRNAGTSKEIASILKIPIASARTRLFYAKQKMKKLIEVNAHKSNIQLAYRR